MRVSVVARCVLGRKRGSTYNFMTSISLRLLGEHMVTSSSSPRVRPFPRAFLEVRGVRVSRSRRVLTLLEAVSKFPSSRSRRAKPIDRPPPLQRVVGRKEWERPACLPGLVRSGLVCLCLPACLLALSCEHDERGWDRRDLAFSRGRVEIPWFLLARREMRGGWKEVKKGGKGKQVRVERNLFRGRG